MTHPLTTPAQAIEAAANFMRQFKTLDVVFEHNPPSGSDRKERPVGTLSGEWFATQIEALPVASPPPDVERKLACGHDHSLGVRNIESNVVFCELCEARGELRDALTMEQYLARKLALTVKALERLASPEAFVVTRTCTPEETARMKYAAERLAAIEGKEPQV